MKGYTIEHLELSDSKKPNIIEQCNYHSMQKITFYGWDENDILSDAVPQTVAIFKIKWKS